MGVRIFSRTRGDISANGRMGPVLDRNYDMVAAKRIGEDMK